MQGSVDSQKYVARLDSGRNDLTLKALLTGLGFHPTMIIKGLAGRWIELIEISFFV